MEWHLVKHGINLHGVVLLSTGCLNDVVFN